MINVIVWCFHTLINKTLLMRIIIITSCFLVSVFPSWYTVNWRTPTQVVSCHLNDVLDSAHQMIRI